MRDHAPGNARGVQGDPKQNVMTYSSAMRFLDHHCLSVMADDSCSDFEWIAFNLKAFTNEWIDRDMARAICRSLTNRGLAAFERGLFTEDGEPAGSGYRITGPGRAALAAFEKEGRG